MFDRCLYFNTNSLSRTLNRIWERAFVPYALSPSQAYLLRAVLTHYGMNHQVLSRTLNLEKSTTSRIVDQLQQKGYVDREHDNEHDARLIKISPTPLAVSLHADLEQIENTLYHKISAIVGQDQLKNIVLELKNIQQALDNEFNNL